MISSALFRSIALYHSSDLFHINSLSYASIFCMQTHFLDEVSYLVLLLYFVGMICFNRIVYFIPLFYLLQVIFVHVLFFLFNFFFFGSGTFIHILSSWRWNYEYAEFMLAEIQVLMTSVQNQSPYWHMFLRHWKDYICVLLDRRLSASYTDRWSSELSRSIVIHLFSFVINPCI